MAELPIWCAGVDLQYGVTPRDLPACTARGVLWQAGPGAFLLDVPAVARYLVRDGSFITVTPAPGADPVAVTRLLRLTPFAALLFQRGWLALHAASVATSEGAIVILGESSTGKSTLAAALVARGWDLLADELAAVEVDATGQVLVHPTFPEIGLWPDTLSHLGMTQVPGPPVRSKTTTPATRFASGPRSLRAIGRLTDHPGALPEPPRLSGARRFDMVSTGLYNSLVANILLDRAAYLRAAATLARSVQVSPLHRGIDTWDLDGLATQAERLLR